MIELVGAVDALLRAQAEVDAVYFVAVCGRRMTPRQAYALQAGVLSAYRWQYIASGVQQRFSDVLGSLIGASQAARVNAALAAILH